MKKFNLVTVAVSVALLAASLACAESVKVIRLNDGSVLKGQVIGLSNGVYTFETLDLGEVHINESEIVSISSENLAVADPDGSTGDAQKEALQNQVQQLQTTIFTDAGIMDDIQALAEDEEIQKLLSDPAVMQDVTSYDQQRIQSNQNIQDLMNNPKIQQLMQKLQQKFSAE